MPDYNVNKNKLTLDKEKFQSVYQNRVKSYLHYFQDTARRQLTEII